MSGLKIVHRLVDFGFNEPTRVYDVVEKEDGRLDLHLILEHQGLSANDLAAYLATQEIKRPVVMVDPHPQIIHALKQSGIRVR